MKINKKIIEELVEYLKEFKLSEIEYSDGTTTVKVSKETKISSTISDETKKKKLEFKEDTIIITSPMGPSSTFPMTLIGVGIILFKCFIIFGEVENIKA